jgi:hypothetical protein
MRAKIILFSVATTALALAVSAFTAPASNPNRPGGLPPVQMYTVTIKQWIPSDEVVDPFMPVPVPYAITNKPLFTLGYVDPNCLSDKDGDLKGTLVESVYHGDGHAGFAGSYRMILTVSFVFDGIISNFKIDQKGPGKTTRTKTYTKKDFTGVCSASGFAKFLGDAKTTSSNSFEMSVGGANPLAAVAPPTFTSLTGQVQPNGDIKLKVTSKDFPSSGVEVIANKHTDLTYIANDASCLKKSEVTGITGAVNLTAGLTTEKTGDVTAVLAKPATVRVRSGLCGL